MSITTGLKEADIQAFREEILLQYPDRCRQAGACGTFALYASQLAGSVAAGLEQSAEAIERAGQHAEDFARCRGQNVDAPDLPLCGKNANS
jgi:hypothetical protein